MTWNLSCADWRERLKEGRTLVPDLPLFAAEGERAVAVLNRLRLADVIGTPTFGEAGGEWFRHIVRAMFGSVDPVTKARYIRELFLLVSKKQSKTTNGALLMLTALLLNQRPRAPFLLTAPFQKQTDEAFSAIAGAIALDPVLDAKLHIRDHLKTIVHRESGARLEVLTFDPDLVTGKKVVGALIDELHVLGKMPRASKAMLQLRGGMQPFPEAFLAVITTQSDEVPAGVFKDDLTRAREVRDGKRTSAVLPVLYEFPEEMQVAESKPWADPKNWPMVLPNLGLSIDLDRLVDAWRDEQAKGEADIRLWASQHLNVQIGMALHAGSWKGARFWLKRAQPGLTLLDILERSDVVHVGIDGGGMDDMLGLAILGRCATSGQWMLWVHAWVHSIVIEERRQGEASKMLDFVREGDLTVIDDESEEDLEQLAGYVGQVVAAGVLGKVGVDSYGVDSITERLTEGDCGVEPEQITSIPQGGKLSGAIKTTERRLAAGTLVHCGGGMMVWCVGNAKTELRTNAMVISKAIAGAAKIDPLMAAFNAVAIMSMEPAQVLIGEDYELTTA